MLQLNADKTEAIWVGSRSNLAKIQDSQLRWFNPSRLVQHPAVHCRPRPWPPFRQRTDDETSRDQGGRRLLLSPPTPPPDPTARGPGGRDSAGARNGHLTTGLLQRSTGRSATGNYRTTTTGTELGGSLDFRAEHPRAFHAMSVTVALTTSTLARPVQTVLHYG